jgi:hypothetical protein
MLLFNFGEQGDETVGKRAGSKHKNINVGQERRRWPRLEPTSVPFLKGITLTQMIEVHAVNISRGGMLLETEVRLRPQMKIVLRLVTGDGVINVEGSVLRSSVASLTGVPKYRSAIQFEHPFHMLDDISTQPGLSATGQTGEALPGTQGSANIDKNAAVLTFVAPDTAGPYLLEMLELNDW